MKIDPIFVSYIASNQLTFDVSSLVPYIYEIKNTKRSNSISNKGGYQSPNMPTNDPQFSPLLEEITANINSLSKELGLRDNIKLGNYWININGPGSFNTMHAHPRALISVCVYIKIPKNSGIIELKNPNPHHQHYITADIVNSINWYTMDSYPVEPKEGLLLAFPSTTNHQVLPNNSDEDRISMALNYGFHS